VPHIAVPEGKADPEVRVWALRPEMGMGAGALSHAIYEQSIVPVRERELARMRIAQINGCVICQQWRSTPGAEGALTEDEYAHVEQWPTYDGYSARERIAIEYAEKFALDHQTMDDAFFDRMKAVFSDREIFELTVCIGDWVAFGRMTAVLDLDEAYYDRMRAASFTDAEILDLTVCIGGWLALGRTLHVLGLDDQCALAPKI